MSAIEPTHPQNLRTFVRVLSRRFPWVVAVMVLAVALSIGISVVQRKEYSASAQLLMQPSGGNVNISGTQESVSPTDVLTELQLITSIPVKAKARERLGFSPNVSDSEVGETNVINVTVTGRTATLAARAANTYANLFVEYQQSSAVKTITSAEQQYQSQINAVTAQISALQASSASAPPSSTAAANAASTLAALNSQQSVLKEELAQLQISATQTPGGIQVVSPATVPLAPSSPRPLRNALLGLAIGLILGIGVAFTVEYFDNKVYTKEDAERLAGGVPVLAMVPKLKRWKDTDQPLVIAEVDPFSPVTESFRALRTSLQFVCHGKLSMQVVVTSASGGEGKTSTVANLGVVLATAGERVIVVGCDLRRPRIGKFLQHAETPGFTSVLVGQAGLEDALTPVDNVPGLFLVDSGPIPPNPAELLGSEASAEALDSLAAECDMVLIDSPPLLPVADALTLARDADAVLLVVEAGVTKRAELRRACELLTQVNVRPTGLILNKLVRRSGGISEYSYATKYRYSYRPERVPDVPVTNGNGHVRPAVPAHRRQRRQQSE